MEIKIAKMKSKNTGRKSKRPKKETNEKNLHSHRASKLHEHTAFGISNGTRLIKHARRSDNTRCRQKGDSNTAAKPRTTKTPKKFSR